MDDPERESYIKKIASLEFTNEQLLKELNTLQELLVAIGFPGGIQDVKEAAQEWLEERGDEN